MAEEFVKLLAPLHGKKKLSGEERAVFDSYLDHCPEFTALRGHVTTLRSVFECLKLPDDEKARYAIMVEVNDTTVLIEKLCERILFVADRLADDSLADYSLPEDASPANNLDDDNWTDDTYSDTSWMKDSFRDEQISKDHWSGDNLRRARKFFESFDTVNASFYALNHADDPEELPYSVVHDRTRIENRDFDMADFRSQLADIFYTFALRNEAVPHDPAAVENTVRYFQASIRSLPTYNNMLRYGIFLETNHRSIEAMQIFRRVLDNITMEDLDAVPLQHLLGKIEFENELYEQARDTFLQSIPVRRKLLFDDPDTHTGPLGNDLARLGRAYFHLGEDKKAGEYMDEGLEIIREVRKKDPDSVEPEIMETSGALGMLYARSSLERDLHLIETYLADAAGIAKKLARANPYYRPRRAFFLSAVAAIHEQLFDIDTAQRELSEAEDIYRELVRESPDVYELGLAKRALTLASFLQHREGTDERERSLWLATEAFVIAVEYPKDETAINIALDAREVLEKWNAPPGEIGSKMRIQEALYKRDRK
jgi:tetratricopeptide (TPR) repeat protein